MSSQRIDVFGVEVDPLDLRSAVAAVLRATKEADNSYVCLCGAHGVVEALRNARLAQAFKKAKIVLPDGTPTVWVGRKQGFASVERVFGPDLMLAVIGASQLSGERHFLLGGNSGVAVELAETLRLRFPKAVIVGTYTPPFRPLTTNEESELGTLIAKCRPDIIWVGISTPKQELFMQQYSSRFAARVMIGVGAAFDFHTGRLKDSSQWVKRAGFQWLHRLAQEPRRLWWRYLRTNTIFIALALKSLFRRKGFQTSPEVAEQPTMHLLSDSSVNE